MHVVVPKGLMDRVSFDGTTLVFRRNERSSLGSITAPLAEALSLGGDGWIAVSVRRGRLVVHRWYDVVVPFEGQYVRMVGEPGYPVTIFVNGSDVALLHTSAVPPGQVGWTWENLIWLTQSIGALLGTQVHIEGDPAGWSRWNQSGTERGSVAVRVASAQSQKRFPDHFRYAPEEPPGEVGLDEASYVVGRSHRIVLARDHVKTASWKVPYECIGEVGVAVDGGHGVQRGLLMVSFRDQTLILLTVLHPQPVDMVQLEWLSEAVRERCRQYRPGARGDASDVPTDLLAMKGDPLP